MSTIFDFGALAGRQNRLYKDELNHLIKRDGIHITLRANNSTNQVLEQEYYVKEYEFPLESVPQFTAPAGKTFQGWAYTPTGVTLEGESIKTDINLTLYAIWGTGHEGWIQLTNQTKPVAIKNLGEAYAQQSNMTLYQLPSGNYAIWNSIECDVHEIAKPIVQVTKLPKYEADDVIYHLKNNTEDSFWHFEYDVIGNHGGIPERTDGNVLEEIVLYWSNNPLISADTSEVYYKSSAHRTFYYDFQSDSWKKQNDTTYGLYVPASKIITVDNLNKIATPESLDNAFYKITGKIGEYTHYCWVRLVPVSAHSYPPHPRVTEGVYWIIDNSGKLWLSAQPFNNILDVNRSGVLNTRTTYGIYNGPWKEYCANIKEVEIIDDIVPLNLSHWFDEFRKCTSIKGLDKIHTDYVEDMSATFCNMNILPELDGIENWNTANVKTMIGLFNRTFLLNELDLSGWNTRNVSVMESMFNELSVLEHIYAGENWSVESVTNGSGMFKGDKALHNWKSGNVGKKYAIIDDGTNGGYLEEKWKVEFRPNGGTGYMPNKYVYKDDNNFVLPKCDFMPPENGIFTGWAYDIADPIITDDEITVSNHIVLYARWAITPKPKNITITYVANNGTDFQISRTYKEKESITISLNEIKEIEAPVGYKFKGWALTIDGEVFEGEELEIFNNTTLYAIWQEIPKVVYFYANNGKQSFEFEEFTGTSYTVSLAPRAAFEPPTDGVRFLGWAKSPTSTREDIIPGTTLTVYEGTSLYAVWQTEYVVTYYNNTTPAVTDVKYYTITDEPVVISLGANDKFTPPQGYTFGGWSYTVDGDKIPGETLTITDDVNLYALWRKSSYTITYRNSISATDEKIITVIGNPEYKVIFPTKDNLIEWNFSVPDDKVIRCWSLQTLDGRKIYPDETLEIVDDIILYVHWKSETSVFVTYNIMNDIDPTIEKEHILGEPITLPDEWSYERPSELGYWLSFIGWSYQEEGEIIKTPTITPTEDCTIYVQWRLVGAMEYGALFGPASLKKQIVHPAPTRGVTKIHVVLPSFKDVFPDYIIPTDCKLGGWTINGTDVVTEVDIAPSATIQTAYQIGTHTNTTTYRSTAAGKSKTATSTAAYREKFQISLAEQSGFNPDPEIYKFVGWALTDGGTPLTGTVYETNNTTVTLYAIYDYKVQYTVTYHSNITYMQTTKVVVHGETLTLPTTPPDEWVLNPSYTFSGWGYGGGDKDKVIPTPTIKLTGDIDLWARWRSGATVMLYGDEAYGHDPIKIDIMAPGAGQYVVYYKLPKTCPFEIPAGLSFTGWTEQPTGGLGDIIESNEIMLYTTTTTSLYAHFEPDFYEVTLDPGDAIGEARTIIASGDYNTMYMVALEPGNLKAPDGYKLDHWEPVPRIYYTGDLPVECWTRIDDNCTTVKMFLSPNTHCMWWQYAPGTGPAKENQFIFSAEKSLAAMQCIDLSVPHDSYPWDEYRGSIERTMFLGSNPIKPIYAKGLFANMPNCHVRYGLSPENIDLSECVDSSHMFDGSLVLTSNVAFDYSSIKDMSYMFANMNWTGELNLGNFNIINDEINVTSMFANMPELTALKVSASYTKPTGQYIASDNMFQGCVKLPHYNANEVDITHADTSSTGYFTLTT